MLSGARPTAADHTMNTRREGILWKWTNYLSGWQPRWFILENGILAYYKSQEDVNQSCKGSLKLTACEILVHGTDDTRLDVVIPSEQHIYLKATNKQERQQWLVSLGTAKACLHDSKTKNVDLTENLRSKMSELRLYCDLLLQQVVGVKATVNDGHQTNVQRLDEVTILLRETCDTFNKTLSECMKMAEDNFTPLISPGPGVDSPLPHVNPFTVQTKMRRTKSLDSRYGIPPTNTSTSSGSLDRHSVKIRKSSEVFHRSHSTSSSPGLVRTRSTSDPDRSDHEGGDGGMSDITTDDDEDQITNNTIAKTFFNSMTHSFTDVQLNQNGGIPTLPFIEACQSLIAIFDVMGYTILSPVKNGIIGNVKNLRSKYQTEPDLFDTLQSVVHHEISTNTTKVKNSTTEALLRLQRDLYFMKEFLAEIVQGAGDLNNAASISYNNTLKPYQGWVVRGVFVVALKALPYRSELLNALCKNRPETYDDMKVEAIVLKHMDVYVTALDVLISILRGFYRELNLEFQQQL